MDSTRRMRAAFAIAAFASAALSVAHDAQAQESTRQDTVLDIRVEGLQRISEGTVYNYLPINIGDELNSRRVAEAVRALYATGFFHAVELRRDGAALIVAVLERPSIESFEITGNKEIKTEELQKSLGSIGLARGKAFDPSVLDEVKRYLTDQYFSRGRYAVRVDTQVEEVPGNKVRIAARIDEGRRARIRQINVTGNEAFTDEALLEHFQLKTPNWLSWYSSDDRYAREALTGDLEVLRSYYMDRGYANFAVTSTQVAIAPDKDDIFITINVDEGDRYTISEIKLAGDRVVPDAEITRLLAIQPAQIYSRRLISASVEAIKQRLGADGYAFATVDPVPQTDENSRSIALTLVIDPQQRAYVRRISFTGSSSVNDEVLRREVRQLEGTYLSNNAVERSRQRIQRLPFIEKVEVDTNRVPGAKDLVNVDFDIEEGLPGQFGGSIGYSHSQSMILSGQFVHSNFMGTGNRIALQAQTGRLGDSIAFSHTDPYTTIDGLQRTLSLDYARSERFTTATSPFDTESLTAGLRFDYPLSEYQWLTLGLSAQHADQAIRDDGGSGVEAVDWISRNGESTLPCRLAPAGADCNSSDLFDLYRTRFDVFDVTLGWRYDSRNRVIFADRGMEHRLALSYTLPGSDVEYWSLSYDYLQFVPLTRHFTLMFRLEAAYGDALGDTTSFPPYRQFYAGGIDTVRGYESSSLGPKDSLGNPYGSNIKLVAQTELLLPMPEKWRRSARLSLFYDIGNVFSNQNIDFRGPPTADGSERSHIDYDFSFRDLRQSAGIALQWLSPLGTFRFSCGIAFNARGSSDFRYPDDEKRCDFSIGGGF